MVKDLFSQIDAPERIEIQGGEIEFFRQISLDRPPGEILSELISTVPWRQESITLWGKRHLQPRLVAWYGDSEKRYTYSGITLDPLPWTTTLQALKGQAEKLSNERFNSVLLNYYRNENDSMGFHSDDEPELGPNPTIASLSFGAERFFVLKAKKDKKLRPIKILLDSGSLLIMKGETQHNWVHGIAKETRPVGPRVNLTFRRIFFPAPQT